MPDPRNSDRRCAAPQEGAITPPSVSRPASLSGSLEAPPRHVLLRRLRFVALGWLVFALAEWMLMRISSRSFDESWDIAVGLSSTVCWTALTLGIWAWVGVLDRRPRPAREATEARYAELRPEVRSAGGRSNRKPDTPNSDRRCEAPEGGAISRASSTPHRSAIREPTR